MESVERPIPFNWEPFTATRQFGVRDRRNAWRRDVRYLLGLSLGDWPMSLTMGQIAMLQTCPRYGADWSEYEASANAFARTLLDAATLNQLAYGEPVIPHRELPKWWFIARREWIQSATASGETGYPTIHLDECARFMEGQRTSLRLVAWLAESTGGSSGDKVDDYSTSGEAGIARFRNDDLAVELDLIFLRMEGEGHLIVASTVMPLLKQRAGSQESCITEAIDEGVLWQRGSTGQPEKLTLPALKERIRRWKARHARLARESSRLEN